VAAATHCKVDLQFDKGLAGGRPEAIDPARDAAINLAPSGGIPLAKHLYEP